MRNANVPQLVDLQKFDVNRRGEYEGIRQSFYDFQTYPSAGSVLLTFFQVPIGQSGKTLNDTNMRSAGQLPQPQNFLVESIEIHFFPGVATSVVGGSAAASVFSDEVYDVGKAGNLEFFIGSKDYLQEAPLLRFPPKTKLQVNPAVATTVTTSQLIIDYAAWVGRPYYLDPPILLVPNQNFDVKLRFNSAVAVSADARIGVVLDGILYRQSQ